MVVVRKCANVKEIQLSVLQKLKQNLKNDLIAGLLVIIPLATTIWLTFTIANWVIDFLTRIPKQLNPFPDFNPFLVAVSNLTVGFAAPLIFILFIGLMARNIVGRWLLDLGERLLQAIPLAGAVYKTLKQILEAVLRDSNNKFRRVVLVEYPRRGIWAMAFVTGTIGAATHPKMSEPMLSVIIPTTPNPTSGWYAIVPEADVINLTISIEDAFKVLISGGIVGASVIAPATAAQATEDGPASTAPELPNEVPLQPSAAGNEESSKGTVVDLDRSSHNLIIPAQPEATSSQSVQNQNNGGVTISSS
ncbi:MAG: DUF502 domain-containing protein [Cyanothece sp. SIO2G6]|nr:DUF502 domain-containing protein [Cyanothece sp. SIO2G6]